MSEKTKEEIQAEIQEAREQNKSYTALKEGIREEEYQKQQQIKAELNQIALEDDKQRSKRLWAEVSKASKEAIKKSTEGQQSYIEFTTAIMDLLHVYSLLNEAIFYSRPVKNTARLIWNKTLAGGKFEAALNFIDFGIKKGIEDIKELVKGKPELQYEIVFDKNGVMDTRVSLNGKELPEKLKIHFDTAIVVWAEENGYEFNPDDGTLKNKETHEPMTSAKFLELNEKPEKCMSTFFSELLKIHAKQMAPSPTPLPTKP